MASALLRQDREQLLLQVDVRTIDSTDIIQRTRSHIGSNFYITRESPLYILLHVPNSSRLGVLVGRRSDRWTFPTWTPVQCCPPCGEIA